MVALCNRVKRKVSAQKMQWIACVHISFFDGKPLPVSDKDDIGNNLKLKLVVFAKIKFYAIVMTNECVYFSGKSSARRPFCACAYVFVRSRN